MATIPIASFRPASGIIRSSAASPEEAGMRKGGPSRRQAVPASGANWWAPIFGWGSGPDYITGGGSSSSSSSPSHAPDGKRSASDEEDGGTARGGGATARATGSGGKFAHAAVVFTEEKARMLRMKTAEASNFHDVMYHSAIASRLASDFHGHDGNGHGQGQGHGRSGA